MLNFVGDNAIALVALVISTITGTVQVSSWRRGRHHISASLGTTTMADFRPDALVKNRFYAAVTVRNAGRPTGIDSIGFDWLSPGGPPPGGFGVKPANQPQSMETFKIVDPMELMGVRRTLSDGEVATWYFVIETGNFEAASKAQKIRAEVRLASGKTLHSNAIGYQPVYVGEGDPPPSIFEG